MLLLLIVLALAGLLARATWIQGVRAASLGQLAQTQHRERVTIPPGRGAILDANGVRLAIGQQATTVYADPLQIRDPRGSARAAARALGLDASALYARLADRRRGFVYVERKADPVKASFLAKRTLPGFGFYPEERRVYPLGSVGAQVLGFAGVDNRGLAGLELALDRQLSGSPGHETIVKDPFGRAIDVIEEEPERAGHDVFLTLDNTIQANAEQVLRETVRTWGARAASAVVLEPSTGKVLAMAVQPGFDANRYGEASRDLQRNRTVTDTFEPGSTFKLVTVAAALSERLVAPGTAYTLPYSIQVADRVVHDAELRGTETMTVAQILARSSNVGAITLAELLGRHPLARWIERFGFGKLTGIDFPGESPGIVLPVDRWSGSTIGNVPIGQGIAVTPLQLAAAYAMVANGGEWVQPHLVDHVAGRRAVQPPRRRILSQPVASELVAMLRGVVLEGTGTSAAIPGYTVAGKTGTAQKPDQYGGYASGRYVASFVGMVPAEHPRLVILITVDEPRGAIFGGVVAAPAFAQIARFDLQYLAVPPDAPAR